MEGRGKGKGGRGRGSDDVCVQGLKTGMYYLRTRPAVDPIKFSVEKKENDIEKKMDSLSIQDDDGCLMCSG